MEQEKTTITDPQQDPNIALPEKTRGSTILNGIGNGMMMGSIPFLAVESISLIRGKDTPRAFGFASIGATLIGAIIGAWHGMKEAKQLENYRQSVREEIGNLREQIQDLKEGKSKTWSDTVTAEPFSKPSSHSI